MIEYFKTILNEFIIDKLDDMWFYIADRDWEFNYEDFYKMINEISDAILDEKPKNIYSYIEEYININYPFNI